ncbi:HPr kinase/phosphatase C-terminal domain-containing protein [Rhodobacteraceae bacterium M382]|nr:HPr kinase/phosphatase C-terminal domain-containing protein [Rhodobacteraceae bacterium M382]
MSGSDPTSDSNTLILHAACVSVDDRGVLILGKSGSGKSGLALQLMGLGATLVADDRVELKRQGADLVARVPAAIAGLIEMRGLGVLRADHRDTAVIHTVVDLDQIEENRLPDHHMIELLGLQLTLLKRVNSPVFAASLLHYLKCGRHTP